MQDAHTAKAAPLIWAALKFQGKTLKNITDNKKKSGTGKVFFFFPIALLLGCSHLWLLCSAYLQRK